MDIPDYRNNNRLCKVEWIMNKNMRKWLIMILLAIVLYCLIAIRMPCGGYFRISCLPGFNCIMESELPDANGQCIPGISLQNPPVSVLGNTPITGPNVPIK